MKSFSEYNKETTIDEARKPVDDKNKTFKDFNLWVVEASKINGGQLTFFGTKLSASTRSQSATWDIKKNRGSISL